MASLLLAPIKRYLTDTLTQYLSLYIAGIELEGDIV
jgi:hypothetical protein